MTDRIRKSNNDYVLEGVLGGIAEHYNFDPLLLRLIWLVLFFGTTLPVGWIYLFLIFLIPESK